MEVIKITLDEIIEEKIRGLRIVDTNVAVSNKNFIYLLTGNYTSIEGFEEAIAGSPYSQELLNKFINKEPHDLLIPYHVVYELDRINKNPKKAPETKFAAREAIKSILSFLKIEGGTNNINLEEFRKGKRFIELENKAKVFMHDITSEEFNKNYNSITPPDDDDIIIHSAIDFIKKNPYKKVTFISDDSNACLRARVYGLETESFRFEEIRNPLQQYKGISIYDIKPEAFTKLKDLDEIDLIDKNKPNHIKKVIGKDINQKFLKNWNIIKFIENSEADSPEEDIKRSYMIYVPNKKILRRLKYYEEFMDFIENYKINNSGNKSDAGYREQNLQENNEPYGKYINKYLKGDLNPRSIHHLVRGFYNEGIIKKKQDKKFIDKKIKELLRMNSDSKIKNKLDKLFKKLVYLEKAYINQEEDNKILNEKRKTEDVTLSEIIKYSFNQNIKPREEQMPYIDHLINPEILLLSVDGKGGFGKTLFALAAALYNVHHGYHNQIQYFVPMANSDADLGALPGTKEEKIKYKVNAARYAIEELFGVNDIKDSKLTEGIKNWISELEKNRILIFDVINDVGGNTYRNTFGIIDEAHNFTRDQAGLILGRYGKGSKVVFLSATEQFKSYNISKYLNERNCGVAHMAEKLGSFKEYAHFSPSSEEIYRGPHAVMAARLLDRTLDLISK